jgi:hypothetical protein
MGGGPIPFSAVVLSPQQNLKKLVYLQPVRSRSCGRVVRLSSAKAATAVRIRSGPLKPLDFQGVFCFYNAIATLFLVENFRLLPVLSALIVNKTKYSRRYFNFCKPIKTPQSKYIPVQQ